MSKPFSDPSLLTKDRLKRELERNGVTLPRGEQKKEVYVNLYLDNLSPQSQDNLENGEFSSDDDGYEPSPQSKQIVERSSLTIKKVDSKEIVSGDIKSLSNNELKDELVALGQSIGPIVPTTRGLYERKLARLRVTPQNNGHETTLSKIEFSDNDFDEEEEQAPEAESTTPDDEFFYKRSRRSGGGGDTFGSTFTKNFQNSSVKKEVTHDVSVSSSRNVEHSSTVDRKTMNKVHKRKGDKFEDRSWSSSSAGRAAHDDDGGKSYDQDDTAIPALPASVQRALTSARRLTPEKDKQSGLRERVWKQNTEEVPKTTTTTTTSRGETKQKKQQHNSSKTWWIIFVIIILLIILTCAVVYNVERLPELKQTISFLTYPNTTRL